MKVTDARGRRVTWSFAGCRVLGDATRPRSSLHLRARALLRAMFPLDVVYEEVPLPGTRMSFDFVAPIRRLAVEVQGEQHFAYSEFFHKTPGGFRESLRRDHRKAEFCRTNGVALAALKFSETDDEWRAALENA